VVAEFTLPERLTTLVIDEGEYAGVEAVVRLAGKLGPYWAVKRLMRRDPDEIATEMDARLQELYELAARDILVSWNVNDHTGPVPVTADGLARVDAGLVGQLIGLWGITTEQVPPPLGPPSPDGAPSGRRPRSRRRRKS
jgi:hypothetical protein